MARTCNVIIIVLDAAKPLTHKRIIEKELEGFGIRLNKQPPNIGKLKKKGRCISGHNLYLLVFKVKPKGGVSITKMVDCDIDDDTVKIIKNKEKIIQILNFLIR